MATVEQWMLDHASWFSPWGVWDIEESGGEEMMVKDLMADLEKGDRTKEMLAGKTESGGTKNTLDAFSSFLEVQALQQMTQGFADRGLSLSQSSFTQMRNRLGGF